MKKYMFRTILLAAAALAAAGCYEDKGNYDYVELGDFYVDSEGQKTGYTVPIFSVLEIDPQLVYDGNEVEDLEYSWRIYNLYSLKPVITTLSDEKILSAAIPVMQGDYKLEFRATEKATGRIATFRYDVTVESSGAGILVLYKQNGLTDCGLITPRFLFGNLEQDAVFYNMYSLANPDYPMTGDPVAIEMYKDTNFQHITVLTDDDGVRLSPMDMVITEPFAQWFAFPPAVIAPQGFIAPNGVTVADHEVSDGFEYLVNDGVIYTNVILFGFGGRTVYGERTMTEGYYASPYVFQGSGAVTGYDTSSGSVVSGGILTTSVSKVTTDLSAIDKEIVYMNYGFGGSYITNAIFRDKVPYQSNYHFYVMNLQGNVSVFQADISNYTAISGATLFAFGTRAQLAYYANGNTIYQIRYSYADKTVENNALTAWTGPGPDETITALELCGHPGRNLAASAINKYLYVGTYNESTGEGKVYVLEVNVEGNGSLKADPVSVYGGFGRIKDFGFKF